VHSSNSFFSPAIPRVIESARSSRQDGGQVELGQFRSCSGLNRMVDIPISAYHARPQLGRSGHLPIIGEVGVTIDSTAWTFQVTRLEPVKWLYCE
jgi:hypothetical protein